VVAEPATEDEIVETVKVMGGEDWMDWITALHEQHMLDRGAVTVALRRSNVALRTRMCGQSSRLIRLSSPERVQ